MKTFDVSIIIPTYNRTSSILLLLNSLKSQLTKNVELIVVEQGTNNYLKISKHFSDIESKITYLFLKKPSLTRARNMGINASKGKIVIFLDDDVIVKDNLVSNHLKNYTNEQIGGVVGRVTTKDQNIETKNYNVGKINILGSFSDGYSSDIMQEVDTVIGCNHSWRKDVLTKVGGFDEKFTGNAIREDSDISLRIKKQNYIIMFDPMCEVIHERAKTGGSRKSENRVKWYFDFFSNETYFFLKHRPKILFPIMILIKYEWFVRSFFGIKRGVSFKSSFVTPFAGILDGINKYKKL
jgi:GT2 family glycosyltransferase